MTKREMTQLVEILDDRLDKRLNEKFADLEERLEKRLSNKLLRHVNMFVEKFEAREQRLIEAFDGKLEMRLKPVEEKIDYLMGEVSAIKFAVRDHSVVQQNHETRITNLEHKVA